MTEHHKPPTDILLGLISLVLFTILGILAILATRRYGNRRNASPSSSSRNYHDEEAAAIQLLLIQRSNRGARGSDEWRIVPFPSQPVTGSDSQSYR